MPCSRGMLRCHVRCGHRELVESYRGARYAQLQRAADEIGNHFQDTADYRSYFRNVEEPLTFRDWLIARAKERRQAAA